MSSGRRVSRERCPDKEYQGNRHLDAVWVFLTLSIKANVFRMQSVTAKRVQTNSVKAFAI